VARLLGTDRDAAFVKGLAPSAKELRLDLRLRFLPQPEIDALCRVAVAGVFPYTRFSAQSGAATLAAGWGLPVIVTDVGALAELAVDERMLVAAGSVAALAAAMNHILGQPDALRLRAVQYAHCTAFAWPKVAERHADLYANLLRGSGIRPA
jgi:glycosyltransferase involved in cell wall biosynthesis